MPAAGQRVHIDGKEVRFADLRRNQVLSFYVPEGATGFTVEPKPDSEIVKVVKTTEDKTPVLMAQADTRTNEKASRLPSTAGPLPLIALGGLMSLLGGVGLTFRRKTSKHTG